MIQKDFPLTPEQRAVVDAPSNARIAVLAVAGAGKTRVLVERALELIGRGAAAERLLFLSFTNDAQQELSRRLATNRSTERCEVRTIHSKARLHIGDVVVLSPEEEGLIKKSLQRRTSWSSKEISQFFQQYGQESTPMQRKLRRRVESKKRALGRQDGQIRILLQEMITLALRRWQHDRTVLASAQASFDYLIVDEYQDVNSQMHEFITVLAGPKPLTVVGDTHQAIFTFQGADSSFLTNFARTADYVFSLETCHRAPAQHVLLAEGFLTTGTAFVPLRGFDGSLTIHEAIHEEYAEVLLLRTLTAIQERNDLEGPTPQNSKRDTRTSIIVDTNAEAQYLTNLLRSHGFNVHTTSEHQKPARDKFIDEIFRPTIRTLAGKRDRQLPLLMMTSSLKPWGEITPEDQMLLTVGWQTERPLDVIQPHCRSEGGRKLVATWQQLSEAGRGPATQLADAIALIFGAGKYDLRAAKAICRKRETLGEILDDLNLDRPTPNSEVLITTVHKAKGREWRDVIVYDGQDQSARNQRKFDKWMASEDMSIQEPACLGYVALTRSLENLTVILTDDGHGKFRGTRRMDELQQLLTDIEQTCSYPDRLIKHHDSIPSFRRWIYDSAAKHLNQADYHAVIQALQKAANPPPVPSGWSDPPRLPQRVVRVPLRGKRETELIR